MGQSGRSSPWHLCIVAHSYTDQKIFLTVLICMHKQRSLHPSVIVVLGFIGVILLSTLVLMLPISRAEGTSSPA